MTIDEIYQAAEEDNIFFVEYADMPAAAGDHRDLNSLAADQDVTPDAMLEDLMSSFMGAIIDLCVLGEVKGEDRVANCQSAWDAAKKAREKGYLPRLVKVREALGLANSDVKRIGTF